MFRPAGDEWFLRVDKALQTDAASLVPGAMRTAARTLRFETEEALELRRFLYSVMECASATLSGF